MKTYKLIISFKCAEDQGSEEKVFPANWASVLISPQRVHTFDNTPNRKEQCDNASYFKNE